MRKAMLYFCLRIFLCGWNRIDNRIKTDINWKIQVEIPVKVVDKRKNTIALQAMVFFLCTGRYPQIPTFLFELTSKFFTYPSTTQYQKVLHFIILICFRK